MNAGTVFTVLSLIPERTARSQSGVAFLLEASSCKHPDRLALLPRFLNWLSPLGALTKDDQRALGLLSANGRPVVAVLDEEDPEAVESWETDSHATDAEQPIV